MGDEWSEGIRGRNRELLHCFPLLLHLCSFYFLYPKEVKGCEGVRGRG